MAKYDSLGFCPSKEFNEYKLSLNAKRVLEILGERKECMVYTTRKYFYGISSIVDAMLGSQTMMGIDIAKYLCLLTSKFIYSETDVQFLISDLVSPFELQGISAKDTNGFTIVSPNPAFLGMWKVFQDTRYAIIVKKQCPKEKIEIFCFKKQH